MSNAMSKGINNVILIILVALVLSFLSLSASNAADRRMACGSCTCDNGHWGTCELSDTPAHMQKCDCGDVFVNCEDMGCRNECCNPYCSLDSYFADIYGICGKVNVPSSGCVIPDPLESDSNDCHCYMMKGATGKACPSYDAGLSVTALAPNCCLSGYCFNTSASAGVCCNQSLPPGVADAKALCDANGDGIVCGAWSCNGSTPGYWTCVDDLPNKYHYSGTYTTPAINFTPVSPRDVGLVSIEIEIDAPAPPATPTFIHIIDYNNSTDSSSWNRYAASGPGIYSKYDLPTPVYGKYFKASFELSSNDGTATPTLKSITMVTTPRLVVTKQERTVGPCWPTTVVYNCTGDFTTTYVINNINLTNGTIKPCDGNYTLTTGGTKIYAYNATLVSARLTATDYIDKNSTNNINGAINKDVCSS